MYNYYLTLTDVGLLSKTICVMFYFYVYCILLAFHSVNYKELRTVWFIKCADYWFYGIKCVNIYKKVI